MRPDFDGRGWPVPLNRDPRCQGSPLLQRLLLARWEGVVDEGYVAAKELGIPGSGRPIPPGECAITSLAMGEGWVFGATSGRQSHVFAYCPQPANETVLHLAAPAGCTAIRNALAWLPGHGLFAGTDCGQILHIGAPHLIGSMLQEWRPVPPKVETLAVPVEGEGVACLIGDAARGRLYGLSDATGTLFSVDAASGEVEQRGAVDELRRFSPHLLLGPDGMVYACGTYGRLVRLHPEVGSIEETGIELPCMAGRGQYSRLGAWALDERTGLIYAGDEADGLLSVLDVRTGEARALGKPTTQPHVRALAAGADGRIYGVAGARDSIGHLFRYNPAAGEMRDLGVMAAGSERRWYGYEIDCAVAGADGRVYFGESDRISHLFVYFPPALSPPAAD